MTSMPNDQHARGPDFASDAVARLYSGEMTEAEVQMLESWLSLSATNRLRYRRALEAWDVCGLVEERVEVASPGVKKAARKRFAALIGIAATLLAAFGALLFVGAGPGTAPTVERYATKIGEIREVGLADGSHVTLNTGSAIFVAYTSASRRVILDQGEAFFDIAKDTTRPLTVAAGNHLITALGTSFSVSRDGNDVTVAVVEGRVAVHGEGASAAAADSLKGERGAGQSLANSTDSRLILEAGEVVQVSTAGVPVIEHVSQAPDRYQSWRFGYIRFDNEPLHAIVAELNRYTEIPVVVDGQQISSMRVSAVFRIADIENAMSTLELILPVTVRNTGEHYLISGADRL